MCKSKFSPTGSCPALQLFVNILIPFTKIHLLNFMFENWSDGHTGLQTWRRICSCYWNRCLFYFTVLRRHISLCKAHIRVMRLQRETTNCEHETHQSLINKELMTVMDCRNCREIGETNCTELRIHSSTLFQGQSTHSHSYMWNDCCQARSHLKKLRTFFKR